MDNVTPLNLLPMFPLSALQHQSMKDDTFCYPVGFIGLKNPFLLCYLNCVVQCLANTPDVLAYFIGKFITKQGLTLVSLHNNVDFEMYLSGDWCFSSVIPVTQQT